MANLNTRQESQPKLQLSWKRFTVVMCAMVLPMLIFTLWLTVENRGVELAIPLSVGFLSLIFFVTYRFYISINSGVKVKSKAGTIDAIKLSNSILGGWKLLIIWATGTTLLMVAIMVAIIVYKTI